MTWLEKLPTLPFGIIANLLALAPFTSEPHLWQKLNMRAAGQPGKPRGDNLAFQGKKVFNC